MSRPKLILRDFFWLILVAAVAVMWWMDRSELAKQLEIYTDDPFGNPAAPPPPPAPYPPMPPISMDPDSPYPAPIGEDPFAPAKPKPAPDPFDPFK